MSCAVGALCAGLTAPAWAQTITFTKIADTATPRPGGTGNFSSLSVPAIRNGRLTFRDATGIFRFGPGGLENVADLGTVIPGENHPLPPAPPYKFNGFGLPSIDQNGTVAFWGRNNGLASTGIYSRAGGAVQVIVNAHDAIPSGTGDFDLNNFSTDVSIDAGTVAFEGTGSPFATPLQEGVYAGDTASLIRIADLNSPSPTGGGTFASIGDSTEPVIDNGRIAFAATDASGHLGIFESDAGALSALVVVGDSIPEIGLPLTNILNFDFDGTHVVFQGAASIPNYRGGFYRTDGASPPAIVVDSNDPIPGYGFSFFNFLIASIDGDRVAFQASACPTCGYTGIFVAEGGAITKLIDNFDPLDGKDVTGLTLGSEGLSGNQVAFVASFAGGSSGVFVATIEPPPPVVPALPLGAAALLFAGLLAGARRLATH